MLMPLSLVVAQPTADIVSTIFRYPLSKLTTLDLLQINFNTGNRTMFDGVIPLMPNLSNWSTGKREVITKPKSHFSNTNDTAPTRKFFLLHGMGVLEKHRFA